MYVCVYTSVAVPGHYSVAYFDRTIVFEALQCRTSVKGGANRHCVNVSSRHELM